MYFDIRYKVTLVVDNLTTNNLDRLSKTITRKHINLETGISIEIDKKNIMDYFTREIIRYCDDNKVSQEDLTIDGYEIVTMPTTKADGVYVYFKSEDLTNFSFEPSIMAVLQTRKEMPILYGEQVNNTTIRWHWETNDTINRLLALDGTQIVETSLGISFYIETGLTPGGTYGRMLSATDDFDKKMISNEAIITLIENKISSIYSKFKVENRREAIEPVNTDFSSKLKAFASGIGDDEDCKLYKADDSTFNRQFKLITKIYGVRASNDIKHHSIKFKYRFKLKGLVDYITYDAKFTIKITATKCVPWTQDFDPTLYGAPIVSKTPLTYTLDDKTQVANIFVEQLIPGLPQNYKTRYKFDVEIYNTSGESRAYMRDRGFHNILNGDTLTFSEHGYFDHKFTVAGIALKKQKIYEELYPGSGYEPLVGVINGDFEIHADGLKDLLDTMNVFETSTSVHDKKYYCVFEEISPSSAYVRYQFDHQASDKDYTEVNGDGIRFYSKSVFADESEHREFITETENGPYLINNNKVNKFNYELKNIHLDLGGYKRFEIEVTSSSSEITILNYPTEPLADITGLVNMPMEVSCRNLQSAIAKWSPIVHNGYYYYNQHEFFLYSKCTPDGQNMLMEDMYIKSNVMIKVIAEEISPAGDSEEYHLSLVTKDQLLLDDYHYEWENNKVWPKPVEVYNDYYMEFATTYEYYSQPFTFDNPPTEYTNISWDEDGTTNSSLEVYGIAYDDIYGVWYSPVKLTRGGPVPEELRSSKVLILKFILKPSRKPKLQKRVKLFSCEADWKNNMLNALSHNIYFLEETLKPMSHLSDGVWISKFMDMGDTAETLKGRSIKFDVACDGIVEAYVRHSDTKVEIEDEFKYYSDWEKVELGTTRTGLKRFVRYMIVVKANSKLYHMNLTTERYEYTGMAKSEYLPGFGNIKVDAKYNPTALQHSYEDVLTYNLPFDAEEHVLLESLDSFLQKMADAQGFNKANITRTLFIAYDKNNADFTVTKHTGINDTVTIKSKTATIDSVLVENNQSGATFPVTSNTISLSPIPQQFSPVIIYGDDDVEPYIQVFFTDSAGKYILDCTENFISEGFATYYLKYIDLDIGSISITIDGIANTDYTIVNNIIKFNAVITKGCKIIIKYRIKKSFVVNYDFGTDSMTLDMHKDGTAIDIVKIYYETNKLSAFRQLTNITFNPIYNGRFNGYVYICDYQDPPQTVDVFTSADFIYANGEDDMNVVIQVNDKNGNPVENVKVNIAAAVGTLSIKNTATDINGVIHCVYTATNENCVDIIKAIVDDNVKGEAKVINRVLPKASTTS